MSTDPLLLRASDLLGGWLTFLLYLGPLGRLSGKVCCQIGMLSPERDRERGLPGVTHVSSQIDVMDMGLGRAGFRPVLLWKTVFCPQITQVAVCSQPGERVPSGSLPSGARHLPSQLGIFEESELDKARAHPRLSFLAATIFPERLRGHQLWKPGLSFVSD